MTLEREQKKNAESQQQQHTVSQSSTISAPMASVQSAGAGGHKAKDFLSLAQKSSKGMHTTESSSQKNSALPVDSQNSTVKTKILKPATKRNVVDPLLADEASDHTRSENRQLMAEQQEYFLCKALHFGLVYLPSDSPLV